MEKSMPEVMAKIVGTTAPPGDLVRAALDDLQTLERIRAHARLVLRSRQVDVEEIVQEVCQRALHNKDRYDPTRSAIGAWLAGFTVNVIRETHRRLHRSPTTTATVEVPAAPQETASSLELDETRALVKRYLSLLSVEFRAVVELRFQDDLDFAEIASKLNLTAVNARQRFRRAMTQLKELAKSEGRS